MPRATFGDEAEQPRDDSEVVRVPVDAALAEGLDHRLVDASASAFHERDERLQELEFGRGVRGS